MDARRAAPSEDAEAKIQVVDDWPILAPKDAEYRTWQLDVENHGAVEVVMELAREEFEDRFSREPEFVFRWSHWVYAGPVRKE